MTKNKTIHRLETPNFHIDAETKEQLEKVKTVLQDANIRYVDVLMRKRR